MKIKDWLTKERWVQGHTYEDKYGRGIFNISSYQAYQHPEIERACITGAIHFCYPLENHYEIKCLIRKSCGEPLIEWNDDKFRTYEEILEVIERLDI